MNFHDNATVSQWRYDSRGKWILEHVKVLDKPTVEDIVNVKISPADVALKVLFTPPATSSVTLACTPSRSNASADFLSTQQRAETMTKRNQGQRPQDHRSAIWLRYLGDCICKARQEGEQRQKKWRAEEKKQAIVTTKAAGLKPEDLE